MAKFWYLFLTSADLSSRIFLLAIFINGSRRTPAPYEKAQASEVICKRAAHPGSIFINGSNIRSCNTGFAAIVSLFTDEIAFYPSALNI